MGHGWHAVICVTFAKYPLLHCVHALAQPPSRHELPLAHGEHRALPAADQKAGSQFWHEVLASWFVHFPAAQGVQVLAQEPAAQKLPFAHGEHKDCPLVE